MLWILAFHIIFVVCWFAGLFYLPRLFVYHAMATDQPSLDHFKIMERKLLFGITLPSGVLATVFGLWLLFLNLQGYLLQGWMHIKLALVVLLWVYNLYCIKFWLQFKKAQNPFTHVFYRWFNEVPVLILIAVVILVVVQPKF